MRSVKKKLQYNNKIALKGEKKMQMKQTTRFKFTLPRLVRTNTEPRITVKCVIQTITKI